MFGKNFWRSVLVLAATLALTIGLAGTQTFAAPAADTDAVTVVQQYYAAYNARDIDKAVSFLADDVVFINPTGTYIGKAKARENLEAIAKDGLIFELFDFKEENGRVVYAYKVIIGGETVETGAGGLTIVKNGLIVFDGTVDTEKQLPTTGAEWSINALLWIALAGMMLVGLGALVIKKTRAG